MASRKDDEQCHPRDREIRRNCGQLLGGLDELLPCFYLAGVMSEGGTSGQKTDVEQGLFAVGGNVDCSGDVPHLGLLLPVNLCRDERIRAAFLKIPPLVVEAANASYEDQRRLVENCLAEAFGGDPEASDPLATVFLEDGFVELTPTAAFFRLLHEVFSYVTEVTDNPAGLVRITKTAPFLWKSYADLMKWRNLNVPQRFDLWTPFTPFLLCGDTGILPAYTKYSQLWTPRDLTRPAESSAIRPGRPDARPVVRLEMGRYGWAYLHLGLDEAPVTIDLSNVYDPFPNLIAWAREIDEGDLPVEMEINEEVAEAVLTALATNEPGRVLLRVIRKYEDTVLLEGIVARAALAEAFKAELLRFFTQEFDPEDWSSACDSAGESLKALVLGHPWLASGD